MNDYKVIYSNGTTESTYDIVTELTEAAARKFFKSLHKGQGLEIVSVELLRENTNATKQQERDALETIKMIVTGLGPQSYLATAFEGCFDIAEQNIEYDFGDSMEERWETAEKELSKAQKEVEKLRLEVKALEDTVRNRGDAISELNARILPPDDLMDIAELIDEKVLELSDQMVHASDQIVELADHPETLEFRNAVITHRAVKANLEHYTAIKKRQEGIRA